MVDEQLNKSDPVGTPPRTGHRFLRNTFWSTRIWLESLLRVKLTGCKTPDFTATSVTADPVSHSEQARRVDERAGHVLIVRHVDVLPCAVVYGRSAAHLPAASACTPGLSSSTLIRWQLRRHNTVRTHSLPILLPQAPEIALPSAAAHVQSTWYKSLNCAARVCFLFGNFIIMVLKVQ